MPLVVKIGYFELQCTRHCVHDLGPRNSFLYDLLLQKLIIWVFFNFVNCWSKVNFFHFFIMWIVFFAFVRRYKHIKRWITVLFVTLEFHFIFFFSFFILHSLEVSTSTLTTSRNLLKLYRY